MILQDTLIEQIANLPSDFHDAGTVSLKVFKTITKYVKEFGPLNQSVETGSGKTTLLFSHLSKNHLVFAFDEGDKSISAVKKCELFKAGNVTIVEGPTQKTLPQYNFTQKFDLALIDGPHGYPFPDLEYYYFYQNIVEGGLLLIDDIQIPTIHRMFEIIKAGDMFQLLTVVDNMAFFRRTDCPLINPFRDDWWLQGYNRSHVRRLQKLKRFSKFTPKKIKKCIPESWKDWLSKYL
jgi:hypothetical protein